MWDKVNYKISNIKLNLHFKKKFCQIICGNNKILPKEFIILITCNKKLGSLNLSKGRSK